MIYRLRHNLIAGRFYQNKDGVTSLEFAFVAPVVVLLMMGIIEFSLILLTTAVMESATGYTARLGKTGYTEEGLSREELIIASIQKKTAGLLDADKLSISATVYAAFDNIGAPEPFTDANGNGAYDLGETYSDINGNGEWDMDMGTAGFGDANDVVVYTVSYPWGVVTPIINSIIGTVFDITVRTVVKNEPYNIVEL